MIVDPNSGLPLETNSVDPRSMSGVYGTNLGQQAGVENPLFYDFMEALPPAYMTVGWNMRRVSNTMMSNSKTRLGSGGRGLRQTFSPLRFGRLANVENIDPQMTSLKGRRTLTGRTREGYSPFNFLAKMGNAPFNASSVQTRKVMGKVGLDKAFDKLSGRPGGLTGSERMFAPGTLGRLAAAGRAGGRGGAKSTANILSSIGRLDETSLTRTLKGMHGGGLVPASMRTPGQSMFYQPDSAQALKSGIGRTNTGIITGRMTGFIHGAEAYGRGTDALTTARIVGQGAENYSRGLNSGAAFVERSMNGGMASRAVGRVASSGVISGAARVAGPLSTALLVKDVSLFLGRSAGRGVKLGIDAVQSAQGDLVKPGPFGMGYKDNSVAATSRQRGVMAISNSRLNMRSFLGNEAASMYQAMG